jgi:hypothetical protein
VRCGAKGGRDERLLVRAWDAGTAVTAGIAEGVLVSSSDTKNSIRPIRPIHSILSIPGSTGGSRPCFHTAPASSWLAVIRRMVSARGYGWAVTA